MNSGEQVNIISYAMRNNPEHIKYCETDKQREYFGKWESIDKLEDIKDVEKLIWCGFMM